MPDDASPTARSKSKAESREKLIEATAASIRSHGIHGTTIGQIQAMSGLSRGMIALHFKGKDNLLLAVAEDLCTRYDAHMEAAIVAAGPDPKAQLVALFDADLDQDVLNARDVAIWFSFRAEKQSDARFRAVIGTRSGGFTGMLHRICEALMQEVVAPANAARLAGGALVCLMEGTWTDFHINPEAFDREDARRTCLYVAAKLFPHAGFDTA